MARKTIAQFEAEVNVLRGALDEANEQIAALRREISRKEAVLRTTQQFYAKAKRQAQAAPGAPSEFRAISAHAKAMAAALGRSVSMEEAARDWRATH